MNTNKNKHKNKQTQTHNPGNIDRLLSHSQKNFKELLFEDFPTEQSFGCKAGRFLRYNPFRIVPFQDFNSKIDSPLFPPCMAFKLNMRIV